MRDSVTVHMKATPEQVWDLVSDVTRIGEFSPETFEARWTRGSTGPEEGASFKGHVKRNGVGPTYWSPCQVTKCVPNEVFEFAVGTDVTESFTLQPMLALRLYWLLAGWARGRTNRQGMRTTLERIKGVVELPS